MLTSFSTQLARAKRRKTPLLIVPVTVLEEAAAVVRGAETQGLGVALTIDATKPMLYSLEIFVHTVLIVGRLSSNEVTVIVRCGPTHLAAEQALLAGAQAIIPTEGGSQEQYVSLLSWCASRALYQGAEVIAAPKLHANEDDLVRAFNQTRLGGMMLPLSFVQEERAVKLSQIRHYHTRFRLPLIIQLDSMHTAAHLQKLKKADVMGVYVEDEFDEAFTAGVRTALRNRSQANPAVYLGKGGRAVEDKVVRYLGALCSM